MTAENESNVRHDPVGAWQARAQDLTRHVEAYLEGLKSVENQRGASARITRRIYTKRLLEIDRQRVEPLLRGL